MNEPYYSFNSFLRKKFSCKVLKIAINAGSSCPNKDGTLSRDGCIFCDRYGAGVIAQYQKSIEQQILAYQQHHPAEKYIIYLQAHTNTYGPLPRLERIFDQVLQFKQVVGLAIATRPDCLGREVVDLLKRVNRQTYLFIELGLQSIHEKSLLFLKRNHTYQDFLSAFQALRVAGIDTFVHLILGIPGETRDDNLLTIQEMNRLRPRGIKLHLLHILKDTALFEIYKKQPFPLFSADEYLELLIFLLERLHPEIVIQRLLGDREKELFVAPLWALEKTVFLNRLRSQMIKRNSFQGKLYIGERI